jgi:hypothetical protein
MTLANHLLAAERAYWLDRVRSGRPMREIAEDAGLSYRQMYYHMRKVGVRADRKRISSLPTMRGRLLSHEDSARLSLLSSKEKAAVIGMVVNDLRAEQSRAISRMRCLDAKRV